MSTGANQSTIPMHRIFAMCPATSCSRITLLQPLSVLSMCTVRRALTHGAVTFSIPDRRALRTVSRRMCSSHRSTETFLIELKMMQVPEAGETSPSQGKIALGWQRPAPNGSSYEDTNDTLIMVSCSIYGINCTNVYRYNKQSRQLICFCNVADKLLSVLCLSWKKGK